MYSEKELNKKVGETHGDFSLIKYKGRNHKKQEAVQMRINAEEVFFKEWSYINSMTNSNFIGEQ